MTETEIKNKSKNLFTLYDVNFKDFQKLFFWSLILGGIYFLPIISSDCFIYDDYQRDFNGFTTEHELGRPFANWLLSITSLNLLFSINSPANFFSIIPLYQIIACIVLIFSCCFFYTAIFKEVKWYSIFIVFSLFANIVVLGLLVYKYDSIHTVTAYALSILASINLKNKNINLFVGTFLICIVLGTYQAMIHVFLSLSFFVFIIKSQHGFKSAFLELMENFYKLLCGVFIYKFFLFNKIGYIRDYFFIFTKTKEFNEHFLENLIRDFFTMFKVSLSAYTESNVLIFFSLISLLAFIIKYVFEAINKRFFSFLIISISIFFILFFSVGFGVFFQEILIAHRCFLASSVFQLLVFYAFFNSIYKWLPWTKYLIIIPVFFHISYSFALGAMLNTQKTYNDQIAFALKNKLIELGIKEDDYLIFDGFVEYAPGVKKSIEKNSLLRMVAFASPMGGQWVASEILRKNGLKANYKIFQAIDQELFNNGCHGQANYSSPDFKIVKQAEGFFVAFRKPVEKGCYASIK